MRLHKFLLGDSLVWNPFCPLSLSFCFLHSAGDPKSEQTDLSHPSNNNGPVVPTQEQKTNDMTAEHTEQDADDEAAEDTDDTWLFF